ncbi:EAL domain-containing protein [Dactylosporangium sp. NPDC051485]|uniref:putative bifunctional diguanylate cyclase/phosphodiesterase n=1 Tax=Dactylosporangium sp. NPDC051485 TaxID=3154846 RepID=UPI003436042F
MSSTSERWFGAGHSTAADSAKAGAEATAAALEGRRPAAVFVFCSGGYDPAAVLAGVRAEAGPDAVVAGGTGLGELTPAGATQRGVAVAALGGEGFTVRAHAAGADAAQVTEGVDAPHTALLLLCDGTAIGPQEFVRGAYSVAGLWPDQLATFAQQAGLALTDARTVEQVREAHRDNVTGLPNRALFLRIFHERPDSAVLFIDLDRFKAVNDSLGHDAGDQLLAAVAERIRGCVRATDTVARLGGDEFAVLLADVNAAAAVAVGGRIIAAVRKPFRLLGRSVSIGASVGAALPGAAGTAPDELLNSADLAMYHAKKNGPGRVVVFEPAMRAAALDYLSLRGDLQRALAEGEFGLQYQPLIRLDDEGPGAVVGVEALLRWNSPARGVVPPSEFLPIAEESGLIADIGQWVLATAARQVAVWRRGRPGLTLNVNVSGHELVRPDFAVQVTRALAAAGLPMSAVTLELTESVLMSDPRVAVAALTDLRALGVQLAIDDFGTGYSSLAYLRELPVDELKVDRAFIARAELTGRDLALVSTIMELGHILGLRVVAEGIENQAQLDAVRRLGCALGQGFHLHRPMDPAQLPALLVPPTALSPAA